MAPLSYSPNECDCSLRPERPCGSDVCEGCLGVSTSVTCPVGDFLSEWSERKLEGHAHVEYLPAFVDRLRVDGTITTQTFILALLYADRYKRHGDSLSQPACGHCVFLGSLVLAAKYLQDVPYNNSHWAKTAGVDVSLLNSVEVWLLQGIRCELYVVPEDFEEWERCYNQESWSMASFSAVSPSHPCVIPERVHHRNMASSPLPYYNNNSFYSYPSDTRYEPLAMSRTPSYSTPTPYAPCTFLAHECDSSNMYTVEQSDHLCGHHSSGPLSLSRHASLPCCPGTSSCDSLEHVSCSSAGRYYERSHSRQSYRYQPYRRSGLSPRFVEVRLERPSGRMGTPAWSSSYSREYVPTANTAYFNSGCSVVM